MRDGLIARRALAVNGIPIETEHLVLRDLRIDDTAAVHAYASDPAGVEFLAQGPNTPDESARFVENAIRSSAERPRTNFELAITLRDGGTLVGVCGIHVEPPEHLTAEIGYRLNREYWGCGYASEAARAIVGFGFEQLGLHRIYATCDPENAASVRVLEKCGMRREGHFVEEIRNQRAGTWRDSLYYAILEREWQHR